MADDTQGKKRAIVPQLSIPEGYVTSEEAARRHGTTKNAITRAVMEGRLPAKRLGWGSRSPLIISEADLAAYSERARSTHQGRKAVPPDTFAIGNDPDALMSVADMMDELGLSRQAVLYLLRRGRIEGRKLGDGKLDEWAATRAAVGRYVEVWRERYAPQGSREGQQSDGPADLEPSS
jgi:hypothetical protein